MVDILHRIGIEGGTPSAVFEKLATIDGLSGWWTEDTSGDPAVGGTIWRSMAEPRERGSGVGRSAHSTAVDPNLT